MFRTIPIFVDFTFPINIFSEINVFSTSKDSTESTKIGTIKYSVLKGWVLDSTLLKYEFGDKSFTNETVYNILYFVKGYFYTEFKDLSISFKFV
jgi:hypothetical protein